MKVALLTDSDVFAGTERHMLDLAVELRALGAAPTLVCPADGLLAQRGHTESLPVLGVEKRRAFDPGVIRRLAQCWREGTFDVLHVHNGRMGLHAAAAAALVRRAALVATQHFLSPARAGRRGLARLAGGVLHGWSERVIQRHVAISNAVGEAMLARGETSPTKLRVILNGIRDPQAASLASREEVRARFGVPASSPLAVCLARLEPEKGLETLIDAMTLVARDLPAARCLVAGTGALGPSLRARAAAAHPSAPVRFLDFVPDPFSLLAAADVFVLPSLAEPFGLSLVEAMALGLPVVATRAGGPAEIVCENVTGRLVPPGEILPLSAAITTLLGDPALRSRMGRAAREDFLARFTARRMAREVLDVYHESLAGTRCDRHLRRTLNTARQQPVTTCLPASRATRSDTGLPWQSSRPSTQAKS